MLHQRKWRWAFAPLTPRCRRYPTIRPIRLFSMSPRMLARLATRLPSTKILKPVSRHFSAIARREGFTIGSPVEYDYAQYQHQVPGGMLSNLRFQLRKVGMEHKYFERWKKASGCARSSATRSWSRRFAVRRQPGRDQRSLASAIKKLPIK